MQLLLLQLIQPRFCQVLQVPPGTFLHHQLALIIATEELRWTRVFAKANAFSFDLLRHQSFAGNCLHHVDLSLGSHCDQAGNPFTLRHLENGLPAFKHEAAT